MASESDARVAGLTALLQLERDARHAESLVELGFLVVNDTRKLVPYRQALLWELDDAGLLRIAAGSGASETEPHAPYVVWAKELLASLNAAGLREMRALKAADVPESLHAGWAEFLAPQVLLVPLVSPQGVLLGGLLFAGDLPWEEGHRILLERLADAYAHAWFALVGERRKRNLRLWLTKQRTRILVAVLLVLLFPLRQSVVVPASVTARSPMVVAAPLEGVIREVHVAPNSIVAIGAPLFSFDNTEIDSQVEVSRKALDVAQAELLKNTQQAYSCDDCRARLPVLRATVEQKDAELRHMLSVQARSVVRAEMAGTAVFQDRNELLGRPVTVGERVMLLARPEDSWLELHLPVEDAISIDAGAEVRFFLNIDPLSAYDATLVQTSFEAAKTAQDVLAYTLMADFAGTGRPRLGLKGTARVYGNRVPLVYYVLRRPLAWARQRLGI
jgi:multidrug efflux pump subunit AcrA (membrane-fusion protein)